MKVRSWSKPHTFQSALCMLRADHFNIDGPPFPVKCVRKFRYALGEEVTYRCVCVHVYLHNISRAEIMHVLYMPTADFQPRADTLDIRCWYWLQFQICHP